MLLNHCLEQIHQNNPLHLLRQKLANLYTHHADFKQQQRFIVLKSKLLRRTLLTTTSTRRRPYISYFSRSNCNWYESFSTLLFAITKGRIHSFKIERNNCIEAFHYAYERAIYYVSIHLSPSKKKILFNY